MFLKTIILGTLFFCGTTMSAQKRIEIESLPNRPNMSWENKESRVETNGLAIVANVSKPTADLK